MPRSSVTERLDNLEDRLWSRYPDLAPLSDPRRWKHAEGRLCATLPRHLLGKLIEGHDLVSAAGRGEADVPRSGSANLYQAYRWVLWRGVQFGAPLDLLDKRWPSSHPRQLGHLPRDHPTRRPHARPWQIRPVHPRRASAAYSPP